MLQIANKNNESKSLELDVALQSVAQVLNAFEVPAVDAATFSIRQFAGLPPERRDKILRALSTYQKIFAEEIDTPTRRRSNRDTEIARAKKALTEYGLRVVCDDFFDLVAESDILEIYNWEGIQIYRNLNFFKTCSYNILDLAVNPWNELYDKPKTASEKIAELIGKMMTTANSTTSYDLGSFIQKEKFEYASNLRTFMITPLYLAPVIENLSGKRAGFISTCQAQIIAEGEGSGKFDLL